MALLTIVTVVRNDADGLARTLASVAAQDTAPDQLVVVDGSDDPTEVPRLVADAGTLPVDYSWSAPRGVYAAMNEGLARVTANYVYFLNAGDVLADGGVVGALVDQLARHAPAWAFGRVEFLAEDGSANPQPAWDYTAERAALFARGRFPAHQGVLVRTDSLRAQGGFDLTYRVAADYRSILRLAADGPPLDLDLTLAAFTVGGLSTQDWRRGLAEFHRARREVFDPHGVDALVEGGRTASRWLATSAYRALWAPGRPLADLVARVRPGGARATDR